METTRARYAIQCVMCIALPFFTGQASVTAAREADSTGLWLGASIMDFEFREFDGDGDELNHEHGALPGLVAGARLRRAAAVLEATLSFHDGDVRYDGQTQSGQPVRTRTDERIIDGALTAGGAFRAGERLRLRLYGGMGYREWHRDIHSTGTASGLDETYAWWYALAGGTALYRQTRSTEWGVDARLLRPLDPELRINFPGDLDTARLDLGARTGYRVALAWRRDLSERFRVEVTPYYEYWSLGRSGTVPLERNGTAIGNLYEPRSETRNVGVAVNVSRRF